jgi:hypothetical protein
VTTKKLPRVSGPEPGFEGMTLNERLLVANLLDTWDTAVAARDRAAILAILRRVAVASPDEVADDILPPSVRHRL